MQDIIIQTNIEKNKSIAKVRCGVCGVDIFEVIEKGKNKDLRCEECKKR